MMKRNYSSNECDQDRKLKLVSAKIALSEMLRTE